MRDGIVNEVQDVRVGDRIDDRPVNITGLEQPGSEARRIQEWREIGLGAQILRDLGITSIRRRTSTPMTYVGLSGFGIEITASEGLE